MQAAGKQVTIHVRTAPEHKAELARAARLAGVPFSEFVRQATEACARQIIDRVGKAA